MAQWNGIGMITHPLGMTVDIWSDAQVHLVVVEGSATDSESRRSSWESTGICRNLMESLGI